jgi:hypothetical protein
MVEGICLYKNKPYRNKKTGKKPAKKQETEIRKQVKT